MPAPDRDSKATTALMGLAAGVIGVWVLDRVDWFLYNREPEDARERTRRVRPGGEPPAGVIVSRTAEAAGRELSPDAHYMTELAVHYSIGIAPAIGYAMTRERLPGDPVARGALFGIGLWAVQDELFNTVSGLGARPGQYPWQAHARGLIAHAAFGIATELALQVMDKALDTAGPDPEEQEHR